MRSFLPLTTLTLALLAPAARAATYNGLPECSITSPTPCGCPNGTAYAQSVTFATIGAKAVDVKALIGDFFDPSWYGSVPFATQGRDNRPGARRSSRTVAPGGTRNLTEELYRFKSDPTSGSFIQSFKLYTGLPTLQYNASNGPTAGFWVTLQSSRIFEYETAIRWSVYACSNGHPLGGRAGAGMLHADVETADYAEFHEAALTNATEVLQAQGKVLGTNLDPVSIQDF